MPILIPFVPFLLAAEYAIALGLYGAVAIATAYGAAVPSRPQRVDGFRATEEYAWENGLKR